MFYGEIKTKIILFKFILFSGLVFALPVFSSEANGTIDTVYRYVFGENIGWVDFGADNSNMVITDDKITGYAYGENIGWLSLHCENESDCATSNYGVNNDGEGNLSGYAYGENIGWVDFDPENGGVWIDTDGYFHGYAYGENIGWIVFGCFTTGSCQDVDYGLKTDWRPASARESEEDETVEGKKGGLDISNVETETTTSSIVVKWKTDVDADSYIRYGTDKNLSKNKKDNKREKKHSITLKNLRPGTLYYFRITSEDKNGNYERTKIYSARTDDLSSSLTFHSLDHSGIKPIPGDYEKLEVEVGEDEDKEEKFSKKEPEEIPEKESVVESVKEADSEFFASVGLFFGKIFGGIKNSFLAAAGFFKNSGLAVKYSILALQDKISDGIFSLKDKEEQGADEAEEIFRHYVAKVYQKQNKKLISAVKFRILDKDYNPIPRLETRLFSDPKTAVTDEKGIAIFNDVEIGEHKLAFSYQGENFAKEVSISDTATQQGIISAEVIDIKAEKPKIAFWMWLVILGAVGFLGTTIYFGKKYYELRKKMAE